MVFPTVPDRSTCSAIMSHYTVAAQGCEGKIIQSPYEAVSGKRMGPNEREVRHSIGGKIVLTTHSNLRHRHTSSMQPPVNRGASLNLLGDSNISGHPAVSRNSFDNLRGVRLVQQSGSRPQACLTAFSAVGWPSIPVPKTVRMEGRTNQSRS
jgi:hypothetical protein